MIERRVEHFTVSSAAVADADKLRLDATFYNRRVVYVLAALEGCGMDIRPLGEVTERVFMPGRFKRTYVSAEHGVPFLQGSHIIHFQPADVKYLSLAAHKKMDDLLIRHGWLLVTRSGTVGRVALVPPEWDGWAASEHVFRVVPKSSGNCPAGYLATFLSSPLGQAQLSAQVYGAVVDELTEEQVRNIRVPVPRTAAQLRDVKKVNDLAMRSLELRAEAVATSNQASATLTAFLPSAEPPTGDTVMAAAGARRA